MMMIFLYNLIFFLINSCLSKKTLNQTILFAYGYSFDSTEIYLNDRSLDEIDPLTFRGLNHLQKLYLQDNTIVSIDSSLFVDLKSLQELWLQSNSLVSLNRDTFIGLNNLGNLFLY